MGDSPPAPAKLPPRHIGRSLLNEDESEEQFLLDYTEKEKQKNKQLDQQEQNNNNNNNNNNRSSSSAEKNSKGFSNGSITSAPSSNTASSSYLLEDQVRETIMALTMGDFNEVNNALNDTYRFSRDPKTRPLIVREGGIGAILSLLVSCKPNIQSIQLDYLEVVLGILWNLMLNVNNSSVDENVVALVSKECSSRLLLAILKPCTSRNKLVFLCCRIMAALVLNEPNASVVARLDGGLTTLLNIVHPRQENRAFEVAAIEAGVIEEVERTPEAVEASLDLLAAFAKGSESNVAALSKLSGFIKISAVITDAMAFPGILRAAFNVFLSCTKTDKYASIIGRSTPAISSALTALTQYHAIRHEKLQVCVLQVLVNLSGSAANLNVLFANKGSDVVMAAMKKPGASPAVIRNCCLVLWKLFMHSQPPPFNLHEYDRINLPLDYELSAMSTFSGLSANSNIRRNDSNGSNKNNNGKGSNKLEEMLEKTMKKDIVKTTGMLAIEKERRDNSEQPMVDLDEIINNAITVTDSSSSANENGSGNGNDSGSELSTSNVSASLLTVGSNLGITGLNINDTIENATMNNSNKNLLAVHSKKKSLTNAKFELRMEEARIYPELAGRPFDIFEEDEKSQDVNGNIVHNEEVEMQKSLGKYLGLDHWSVTKHMQRLITDEFEETVIGIVNKIPQTTNNNRHSNRNSRKNRNGHGNNMMKGYKTVNAPTKTFVIDHDALPHAFSKRPSLSQSDNILKPVNDEMFLKVQVQHVERLIDRVKTLNRVVYDVNKAPPFDTIEVFPHKNTNAESKQRESTKISTTHGLNDMKIKNTVEEAHIFEARRAARKRDMIRLGKLCDQAIAGQLRVAGTGKAAAAVAAARAAAAKSCGVDLNGTRIQDLQSSLKSIKKNGPSSVLDGNNLNLNKQINELGGKINNSNSSINNFLQFNGVPPLLFESRFECGNLYKAVQATETEYDLVIAPDINNGSHTQWYYFSVFGLVPDVKYKFNFINLEKPDSMYNYGMQPLVYSERDAEDGTNCGWTRKGSNVCYYQNFFQRRAESKRLPYYTFTFTYTHHRPDDRVYFSYCYPYTYTNVLSHLKSLQVCERKGYLQRSILCKTLAGNPVPLLTVTNFNASAEEIRSRRYTVISARVHPGETPASFMMESIIDFLTGPSELAFWLRDRMVFKIIPMLNVDGVVVGNHRCNLAGLDLNRQWSTPTISQSPTIYHLKQMIETLASSSRDVLMFCDLHAHSRSKNIFMYGCENPRGVSERIIPYMLSNADPSFHFDSCDFKVKKSKSNCGRVVVWRQFGLVNSYTMEASFCCAAQGPRRNIHFKPSCFESLGRAFCQTIAKAIKKDQRKVLEAGAALAEMYEKKSSRGYGVQVRPATKVNSSSSTNGIGGWDDDGRSTINSNNNNNNNNNNTSSSNNILNGGGNSNRRQGGGGNTNNNRQDQHSSILVTKLPRQGKNAVSAKSRKSKSKKRRKRAVK